MTLPPEVSAPAFHYEVAYEALVYFSTVIASMNVREEPGGIVIGGVECASRGIVLPNFAPRWYGNLFWALLYLADVDDWCFLGLTRGLYFDLTAPVSDFDKVIFPLSVGWYDERGRSRLRFLPDGEKPPHS